MSEQFEAEKKEIARYKPPSNHRIKFKRRVFETERWIEKQGLVQADEVISFIMKRFDLERPQALEYFAEVEKDFQLIGRVYGK